jgi:asparagine synthetase B (glutamine-hydrolysing)
MRDPLGLNKLFWAQGASDTLFLSARPKRLVAEGFALEEIRAVPRGCILGLRPGAAALSRSSIVPKQWQEARAEWAGTASIKDIGTRIRCNLDWYLAAIAEAYPAARAFVCCSGGLDSSGIAALVARHFSDVVGVSFDLDRRGCGASEDRAMAERLCHDLGIPLLKATVRPERLLDHLDTVLVEGIDWRDFNVHAGLVNAVLAEAVAATKAREPIVFTGDLANEFLADYHEEKYQGETYYRLPRLSPGALRASLVRGLDTSNREVGVFAAWGLPIVQPYAVAVMPTSICQTPSSDYPTPSSSSAAPSSVIWYRATSTNDRRCAHRSGMRRPVPGYLRPALTVASIRSGSADASRFSTTPILETSSGSCVVGVTAQPCQPERSGDVTQDDVSDQLEAFLRIQYRIRADDSGFARDVDLFEHGY